MRQQPFRVYIDCAFGQYNDVSAGKKHIKKPLNDRGFEMSRKYIRHIEAKSLSSPPLWVLEAASAAMPIFEVSRPRVYSAIV